MNECRRCGIETDHGVYDIYTGTLAKCERCSVEEQVLQARELIRSLPDLERRLSELGGPAERVLCGMMYVVEMGSTRELGDAIEVGYSKVDFCKKLKGHDLVNDPCAENKEGTKSSQGW